MQTVTGVSRHPGCVMLSETVMMVVMRLSVDKVCPYTQKYSSFGEICKTTRGKQKVRGLCQ